ncbi:MAG: hypothetical protein AAGU74_05825 [Bacillota bacterium]
MAVAAGQANKDYYAPSGYAYTSTAATAAQPAYEPSRPARRPAPAPQPRPRQPERTPGYRVRPDAQSAISPLRKAAMIFGIMGVSAALLLVLARYARISDEYSVVNDLKSQIAEQDRNIETLNVALEFAMTIQEADAAAKESGMNYPSADQIVKPGELTPSEFQGRVDEAKTAEDPDDTEDTDPAQDPESPDLPI